jgi:hypothetical protein
MKGLDRVYNLKAESWGHVTEQIEWGAQHSAKKETVQNKDERHEEYREELERMPGWVTSSTRGGAEDH